MDALTERQRAILGMVVRTYIETAAPVGSATLARRYALGVSPATVRNELAYLEQTGYLTHPHTSAGRVPTIQGYRYFVEQLMQDAELPAAEQRMIRHQFHQAGVDIEEWVRLAAAVLARTAGAAALATLPHAPESRLKHLELIAIRDPLVLLIVVLEDGTVQQQMLTTSRPISQDELSRVSNRLNSHLAGLTRREIAASPLPLSSLEQDVVEYALELMGEVDRQAHIEVYRDGLINILSAPEFADTERAQAVLRLLEEGTLLEAVLAEVGLTRRGVQVIIGGEGRWEEMRDCSLVMARYGPPQEAVGVLGVFGPVRLPYERAVSSVRYVARLMTELVRDLYGY
jgi:heat-inducible transcriptional repressor